MGLPMKNYSGILVYQYIMRVNIAHVEATQSVPLDAATVSAHGAQ